MFSKLLPIYCEVLFFWHVVFLQVAESLNNQSLWNICYVANSEEKNIGGKWHFVEINFNISIC